MVSDNCGVPTVSNNAPSSYPIGTTIVTWTVTDGSGNMTTCQQSVTVVDNQMPTISNCPGNVAVNAPAGSNSVSNVNLGSPTVSDNCGVPTVSNNAPSSFPIGTTIVTWTVTDGSGNMTTCQQSVSVAAGDTAPVANGDSYSVQQDTPLTVSASGVLANDTDAELNPLTAMVVTTTTNGVLSLSNNGSFTYTPNPGFSGTDTFTYKANDGFLDSNIATVTITVTFVATSDDNDLYAKKASVKINWAKHKAGTHNVDSFKISGNINPRGISSNLAGATIDLSINGVPVAPTQTLNATGIAVSASPKIKYSLSAATGRYTLSVRGVDLRNAVGLANATSSGMVVLDVTLTINGANLDIPVVANQFETPYVGLLDKSTRAKFAYRINRALDGVYNSNRTGAAQQKDNGFKVAAKGAIETEGSDPIVPNGPIKITIGGNVLNVPLGSLVKAGTSDATSIWTYSSKLGVVSGLAKFSISNVKHAFRLTTGSLNATGVPLAGPGAAISHRVQIKVEVPTANGPALYDTTVELKRPVDTATKWKR